MTSDLFNRPSRRGMLATLGAAGAAVAGTGMLGSLGHGGSARAAGAPFEQQITSRKGTTSDKKVSVSEVDILNFALNLEYLEAEFYLRATTGSGLTDADSTGVDVGKALVTPGAVTAFTGPVPFVSNSLTQQYALEIANDELAHVRTLRAALGKFAVARPALNLQSSFVAAATAAGIPNAASFNPFADEASFLLGAYIFEDVGVTAYKGGAPYLSSKYIPAAAGLLSVEAYHAGLIRTTIYALGQATPALIVNANLISDARDAVDGGGSDDDQHLTDSQGNANIVPTDGNGLTYSRTLNQVLNVVYLTAGDSIGVAVPTAASFFPLGMNGKIS